MVAKYPNDPSYVVMFCNWLMNNGRTKEAGKRLQQVLKENPTDVGARLTMLDFYSATGKKEKEKDLAEQLMTEKDVPSKTKLALLRQTIIDYDKTDSTAVERLFDKILATPQKDGDMYMMKAAYMALHKQPTEAIDTVYQQALKRNPTIRGPVCCCFRIYGRRRTTTGLSRWHIRVRSTTPTTWRSTTSRVWLTI